MTTTNDKTPGPGGLSQSWTRPVVFGLSFLVLGFVGGWVLHGGGASRDVLPKVSEEYLKVATTPPPATTEADGSTAAAPADDAIPPPDRSQVSIAVLNATTVNGLAAKKAAQLRGLRYVNVSTGNAPTSSGTSVVYFRPAQRSAARQAAGDLGIAAVEALPTSGPIAAAAEAVPQSRVLVVLRSA